MLQWQSLGDYAPQPQVSQNRRRETGWRVILGYSHDWQLGVQEQGLIMIWPGITGNRLSLAGELDHSPQNYRRQIWDRNDSLTPPFNPSKNQRVAMGDDAASVQANADAIVTDEPREITGCFCCRDQA